MSQSFSYEDLVLSSRFERVMNRANAAVSHATTAAAPTLDRSSPIHYTVDPTMIAPPTRMRAQTSHTAYHPLTRHHAVHQRQSNGSSSMIANHPAIHSRMKLFWLTLRHHTVSVNDRTEVAVCLFEEWQGWYCKLTWVMLAPHYHHTLAIANCEAEWYHLSQPHPAHPSGVLTRAKFLSFLFDTVTLFVHLTDYAQFVFTLNKLYTVMTQSLADRVVYQPLNDIPMKSFNEYTTSVSECQHYVSSIAERYHWALLNDSIDFSMPLLPSMRVEPVTDSQVSQALRATKSGYSVHSVRQGPNREGWAFSIASMPPGYDSLAEIGGIGALPTSWSPHTTLTRLNSSPTVSLSINDTDDEDESTNYDRLLDPQGKRRRSHYERKEDHYASQSMNEGEDWSSQPTIAPIRDRARSSIVPPTSSIGSPIIVVSRPQQQQQQPAPQARERGQSAWSP